MSESFNHFIQKQLDEVRHTGLYKTERVITSAQQPRLETQERGGVLNFCANNYLGLANHPELIAAACQGTREHGFGMASVRFICGTQDLHKSLEARLADFVGTEDVILYSSCFDANTGLFETLFDARDAILSDALNHASIIDGVRLCKAQRFRYANNDMADLESKLQQSAEARFRLIATDGVFSMDGVIANLPAICELADRYDALVMVDDSHAVGFMGAGGRGTHQHHDVMQRVDILTGTLGKAMGGASGGYTAASKEVVEWLRQRSRPYLFSNSLAPGIVNAGLRALELLQNGDKLRQRLWDNSSYFRERMQAAGFTLGGAGHPIIPIMIGDAAKTSAFADALLDEGVYVIGFSYPVVPQGAARIRTQMCAAHTREQLDFAIDAFERVATSMAIL